VLFLVFVFSFHVCVFNCDLYRRRKSNWRRKLQKIVD
jgi:hypothetical protein